MISLQMLGKCICVWCFFDGNFWLEHKNDELYARYFLSVFVFNFFKIRFPLQVYPWVHEQRDIVTSMIKKCKEKMIESLSESFNVTQGIVRCPAISEKRRLSDTAFRVAEWFSVHILKSLPRGPNNRNSFDLKT